MACTGFMLPLMMTCVAMVVTSDDPWHPLPKFSTIETATSENTDGAMITLEYFAPEKPFALWYVNGLPMPEGRVDYVVANDFNNKTKRGVTILSSLQDKSSLFAVCLHNFVAENCVFLRPLNPSGVTKESVVDEFPWPLYTPGPLVRYNENQTLKIHAPELNTPHSYSYTAMLYSRNPYHRHGQLVQEVSNGMEGGLPSENVTISPASRGTGWIVQVRTDRASFEGVMLMNTTFVTESGPIQEAFLIRPFTIHRRDHNAPFDEGFVAPIANPITWKCRLHMACMVVCPFLSNAQVNVTVSRMMVNSVLNAEFSPGQPEEEFGESRMLGPYMGYGAIFIPDFLPRRDVGNYKCKYKTGGSVMVATVKVE